MKRGEGWARFYTLDSAKARGRAVNRAFVIVGGRQGRARVQVTAGSEVGGC